ncbi:MAG: DUF309 domain-containing protein [Thaumarchaeota archaeon]|nr:DUF309 domain-containing protein [Nitrososphaerota archaeon]
MDRFMVHLENRGHTPREARALLARSRELTSGLERTIRDARVATSHVELDVSVDRSRVGDLVGLLGPVGRPVRARLLEEGPPGEDAMGEGAAHFNSERFWESHEALEGPWAACAKPSAERDAVQGIILAAAAMVHHQKDEDAISLSILARAARKLAGAPAEYGGIDVAAVRGEVDSMLSSRRVRPFLIRPSRARP